MNDNFDEDMADLHAVIDELKIALKIVGVAVVALFIALVAL